MESGQAQRVSGGDSAPSHANFLERVADAALCGIYVFNLETRRNDYINPEYTALTGWTAAQLEALSSDEFFALFHPEDRAAVAAHMQQVATSPEGHCEELEYRFRRPDGSWMWCLARDTVFETRPDGTARRFIGTFLDITPLKKREEQRVAQEAETLRAQKLESLGMLAGGIAHDFNNLLAALLGNAELALDSEPGSPEHREHMQQILSAGHAARDLIAQLVTYTGRTRLEVTPVDVSALVAGMQRLLQVSISKKHTLKLNLPPELPAIHADASRLRQALLNLVANASQAIGDRPGHITVSTGMAECSADYLATALSPGGPSAPGTRVWIEVTDDGEGIDPEQRKRVFDPFYSTRTRGHGLGLAAVWGIVRSHGGCIDLRSHPNEGTSFRLLFDAVATMLPDRSLPKLREDRWRGEGRVLVVDDERAVREVVRQILERFGFQVITASDGQAAAEVFARMHDELDLVLLDLHMPRLSGAEAFEHLRRTDPCVPVVAMSGYDSDGKLRSMQEQGLSGFLQKPFSATQLQHALQELFA